MNAIRLVQPEPLTRINAAGETPSGKTEPEGGAKFTDATPEQLSLTAGAGKMAVPVFWPGRA